MEAVRQANNDPVDRQSPPRRLRSNRLRAFLLWYCACALPHDSRWLRTVFVQLILGGALALFGMLATVLGWIGLPVALGICAAGLVVVALLYPMSRVYYTEYPGRFNPCLEEYVVRRVSRLSKDAFIPHYRTNNQADSKRAHELIRRVGLALRVEKLRLAQRERVSDASLCGIVVVGPRHANKTGALWDAMAQELKGWTFVRWPHHLDHLANLALRVGRRVVLWVDNVYDFAHPGEAAALTQFIQQVRDSGRPLLVLATCRDGYNLLEAQRYFCPLMNSLQRVYVDETLSLPVGLHDLKVSYEGLAESQKGVLRTIDWLQQMQVFTFPEEVLQVLNPFFVNDIYYPYFDDPRESPDHAPTPDEKWGLSWEKALQGIDSHPAKFVRIVQRADAQTHLSDESYNVVDWVRYALLNRLPRSHKVVEPVNALYLDLEDLDDAPRARTRAITNTLEQRPGLLIQVLASYPAAVETLILLGDAYLHHLGEYLTNAGELAITCYNAALQQLDQSSMAKQLPGAWAAAHIGKGSAELRLGLFVDAADDFRRVTERPEEKGWPIPPMLLAQAWAGRAKTIAAQLPATLLSSDAATTLLEDAVKYYERAVQILSPDDALLAEIKLDRANMLYAIIGAAFRQSARDHAHRIP